MTGYSRHESMSQSRAEKSDHDLTLEAVGGHEQGGEQQHGARHYGAAFVIDQEPAVAAKHAQGLLDPPPLGLDFEPGLALAPDQLEVDAAAGHRCCSCLAAEGEIGPDLEQRARGQLGLDLRWRLAVLDRRWHHLRHPQQAQGVDQQHALAAFGLLTGIMAARAALRTGFDALGVQNAGTGPPLAALGEAQAAIEYGQSTLQHSVFDPAPEPAANGLAWRIEGGQELPSSTSPAQPPERLQHDDRRPDPWSAGAGGPVDRVDEGGETGGRVQAHHVADGWCVAPALLGRPGHDRRSLVGITD